MTFTPAFQLTAAERIRVEAIDRLVVLGPAGVDELLGLMSDPSWTVRRAVVAALAALGDDAVAPLCTWLRDRRTSEHALAAAVDALSASLGAATGREVIALLGHPDPAVAADAAQILGRRRTTEAVPALEAVLDHADDNVAISAIDALGEIGSSASIEPLIAVLLRGNFFRTFAALQVLPKTGDPRAVVPLAGLLEHDGYRIEAIHALGRTGLALAIAPLATLLTRPAGDAMVRPVAVALAALLARAEWTGTVEPVVAELRAIIRPALARFVASLRGADPAERAAIAAVLGRIGDATALPALARLLDDPALVSIATEAIQRISRADETAARAALTANDTAMRAAVLPAVHTPRAAPGVLPLLADDNPEVRAGACDALARIGDTTAVGALFAVLGDPNLRVAHAAAAAIQSLGSAETAPRAIAAITAGPPAVRRQALRIVAYLGCLGAYDAAHAATEDPDPRIAELAVAALGALDDPRVSPALAALARDRREGIRAAAMRATAQRSDRDGIALLERGLGDDSAWVRYYACQGLGRSGHVAAVPALIGRLSDATPHVRIAAVEALAYFDTPAAWQALCSIVRSSDPDEQRAALVGIGMRAGDQSLAFLLEAARSTELSTQLIALHALAPRPEPGALAAVVSAGQRGTTELRDAAISLLAERTDRAAADALVELALAAAPDHPAHFALSRPAPVRIAAIASRLATAGERATGILVAALARMRAEPAVTALGEALQLANPLARRAAAAALVALGAPGARARVAALAAADPDHDVRRACAAMLGVAPDRGSR
ncbi:MAG TPA: HEAT repeat domain-containing protein [Kofleriaceae bacterium]|nr:HEAT repeat domain-containing protein [Kofleriaceae bacterium]